MTSKSFFPLFDTAFRIGALVIALTLMAFLMVAGAQTAFAAALRSQAILTGDTLTVGDIFENAGRNSDYVLGPAPQPGRDMTLNAPTLLRIALALDLPWAPQSAADQIVVRRAATLIGHDMIRESLISELRDKGVSGEFSIDTGAARLEMNLPQSLPAHIDVVNLQYNPRTQRFDATIMAPSAQNPIQQISVSGTVRGITKIPVLRTSLRNGDIIGASDIDMIEIYESDIQQDMYVNAETIIGMTPRRMAVAGRPLRTLDLQSPQLVGRGESVTIVFNEGPLKLTATGKALQNGAKGEMIRVVNNTSNRPLDAIVSNSGEVIVRQ